jgi:hypothetical protein
MRNACCASNGELERLRALVSELAYEVDTLRFQQPRIFLYGAIFGIVLATIVYLLKG